MRANSRPAWLPYLASTISVVVASVVGGLLAEPVGPNVLYVTYFAAVTFAGWYGGLGPALLATALTYLTANLFFVSDRTAFTFNLATVAFLFACLSIATLSEAMRRALTRARASAAEVTSIVESITDGFIAFDNNWRCTYTNRAAEELNRQYSAEIDSNNGSRLFPLSMGADVEERLRQAAANRTNVELEKYYEPWQRWFEIKAWPANTTGLAVFFRDITERKLAQLTLAESEQRLRLSQRGAKAGMWDRDLLTGRSTWSEQYYEVNGIERTRPASFEAFVETVHPEDRASVADAMRRAIESKASIDLEYRIQHSQLGTRWIAARGQTTADAAGRAVRVSGIVLDITERKRAEESLRFLSEAGTVLSNLVDVQSTLQSVARLAVKYFADYCVVDMLSPLGQIERVAYAHRDLAEEPLLAEYLRDYPVDWDSNAIPVQVLRSGVPRLEGEAAPDFIAQFGAEGRRQELLTRLAPASFIVVPLMVRERPIGTLSFASSESGRQYTADDLELASEIARRVATATDNSRLYAELTEAQQQKDDFLAMLAHELRNPLAAISYANTLAIASESGRATANEVIGRQVANLSRMLDDLLDVSRITRDKIRLKKELVDGAELARRAASTVQPLIDQKRHTLALEISDEPLPLQADPIRVEQILSNLLTNAAKYTPEGGAITLKVEARDGSAWFSVKDSGIGIPPALLSKIFDLFMQADRSLDRSQGGLGVGLTVVRKLAEMHGGSVAARSEGSGKGSEFSLRLPLASGQLVTPPQPEPEAQAAAPMKVLMVDDNVDLAQSISKLLTISGHEVATAYDGLAAVETALRFEPNVVLLDLGLPGLDGYSVAQTLRREKSFANVRFIAISGYGQPEDRKRTREAGFDHHLVKPVNFEALLSILAKC